MQALGSFLATGYGMALALPFVVGFFWCLLQLSSTDHRKSTTQARSDMTISSNLSSPGSPTHPKIDETFEKRLTHCETSIRNIESRSTHPSGSCPLKVRMPETGRPIYRRGLEARREANRPASINRQRAYPTPDYGPDASGREVRKWTLNSTAGTRTPTPC